MMLDALVKKLERGITVALLVMLAIVVALATVELGVKILEDVAAPPAFFPGIDKLLDIFSRFLLVLIGVELIETMRTFALEGVVRVEVVLTVATIAIARKVVVLEIEHVPSSSMLGLAALLASLALAYLVIVRGGAPELLPARHRPGAKSPTSAPNPLDGPAGGTGG
jgi:uncharacterized membrane protein (DUF373 family)